MANHTHFLTSPSDDGSPSDLRSSKRRFAGAVLVGVLVLGVTTSARALSGSLTKSAKVAQAAVRLTPKKDLAFPIDPSPKCLVLNNYGGDSKTFGVNAHQGVDIGASQGQAVYAVETGVLYRQWTDLKSAPGLGWGLASVTDTRYRYYHLADFAPGLKVGDRVEKGQLLGHVGDTGNAAEGGWHLHFEVHPGPDPYTATVDPVPLLTVPAACTVYKKQ